MLPEAAGVALMPLIVAEVALVVVQLKVTVSPFQTVESEEERVQEGQLLFGGAAAVQLPEQLIVPKLVCPQELAEVQALP